MPRPAMNSAYRSVHETGAAWFGLTPERHQALQTCSGTTSDADRLARVGWWRPPANNRPVVVSGDLGKLQRDQQPQAPLDDTFRGEVVAAVSHWRTRAAPAVNRFWELGKTKTPASRLEQLVRRPGGTRPTGQRSELNRKAGTQLVRNWTASWAHWPPDRADLQDQNRQTNSGSSGPQATIAARRRRQAERSGVG